MANTIGQVEKRKAQRVRKANGKASLWAIETGEKCSMASAKKTMLMRLAGRVRRCFMVCSF
jgi:hypothetical protein